MLLVILSLSLSLIFISRKKGNEMPPKKGGHDQVGMDGDRRTETGSSIRILMKIMSFTKYQLS